MNKKLLILLAIALIILPVAASCGRTAVTGVTTLPAPKVPHAVDVRFENCNACHVNDQLKATKPMPHMLVANGKVAIAYSNKDCISAACHVVSGATTPPSTVPPTTTTTATTGATNTTSTNTTSTTTAAKTLPDVGLPITSHSKAALTAYKAIGCLFCHGQGPGKSNEQPYAPTWDATAGGSVHYSGIYTVPAGSKADHTGYTEATDCSAPGCHAAPTS